MPFCSKCGGWYADEDLVCSTCGCTVSPSVQSTQPEDPYLFSMPQPTDIPPVQTAWDPFSQPAWDAPAQPAWEAPVQPSWETPAPPAWEAPVQPSWETPAPPAWEAPVQPSWETPAPPAWEAPVQPSWDASAQPSWEAPAQPTIETPGQPAWENPAQPAWDPFPQPEAAPPAPPAPESPAQSAKKEPGQPKTAFLLGIIATLALLLVLLIGLFVADYFTDREVNLFGLLASEKDRAPASVDTTAPAPTEETLLPMPTEPIPTVTETKPEETPPEETLPEETLPQDTVPAVTEPIEIPVPVQGQIVLDYAMDCLTYNPTTKDWRVHDGVDIAAEAGTPVRAVADGTVSRVYQDDTMGNTVVIEHPDGYTTYYSSLAEEISVHPGDAVRKGQTIGSVGKSALLESAIEYHVHFSARLNGQSVDPNVFITTIDLSQNETALTEVMDGKLQLMTDSQSVMYLSEYLNLLEVNEIDWWTFVDFDQDGYPEVYAVTDSPVHSYLVLHWNGTQVCAFSFGHRSMQTLKTNGWFSASNSAYESYYLRITFHGNSFTEHTLASFDTRIPVYQIDGKAVNKAQADQFREQWHALPDVTRPGSVPPEETDPQARCAYCGVWHPLSQMKNGLCSECQGQAFQCQVCRKWSTTVFEGFCEECDPAQWEECPSCGTPLDYGELDNAYGMCDSCLQNGGKCSVCGKLTGYLDGGKCSSCQTADCVYCGVETNVQLLANGLCEECWYWRGVGWCIVCGRLSDNLFEGVCEVCEPWGGRGEPEECCVHCGKPSYDLVTGICNDCYWYVGWCSVCGNLAYEIYDGVCTDCAPRDDEEDPEEYMSQCSVCGEWSDTVFEGVCDNCGGYNGMG